MRRSFKWILGLLPIVATSVGTAVYLTSENSISSFSEVNNNRQNIQVETRISPLASSQDAKENTKTELLNPEKLDENVNAPKKIIVPESSEILPQKKENPKPNSAEKQTKTPIVIGEIPPKSNDDKKKEKEIVPKTNPGVVIFLPPKKTDLEPKEKEKQQTPKERRNEKVVIADKDNPESKIPKVKQPELPVQAVITETPKQNIEKSKIDKPPVESPILAPEEVKTEKTPAAPQVTLPQVKSEEEQEKERKKQEEEARKKQLAEEQKQKQEQEEKERLQREKEKKEQEEKQHKEEAERLANEEAKRRQEEEEKLKNVIATPNLGSSTAGINTGDSVVDGLISEMNKDLGVSDPQVWVDKYPLADWQLTKFLENLPTPRNDKEISNISSFWVLSHARNWFLSPATSWLVITEDVRKIWREQINNKLNLKMTGNGDNAKIITQSGGVLGGSDHP